MIKKKYLSLLAALTAIMLVVTGCGSDSEPTSGKTTKNSETEVSSTITPDDKESDNSESETDDTDSNNSETDDTDSETETDDTANNDTRPSEEEIIRICSTRATCETDINACYVDITSDNPYDVTWDYGEEYNNLVAMCDWSLVWDYDFYVETYPELAALYHYDKDLLLRHFQTIGVHEGRQGSKNFHAVKTAECNDIVHLCLDNICKSYLCIGITSRSEWYEYSLEPDHAGIAHVYFFYMLYPEIYEPIANDTRDYVYLESYTALERNSGFYDYNNRYNKGYDEDIRYILSLQAYNNAKNNINDTNWIENIKNHWFISNNYKSNIGNEYGIIPLNLSDQGKLSTDMISSPIHELIDTTENDVYTLKQYATNTIISNIYYNPDADMSYCIRLHY